MSCDILVWTITSVYRYGVRAQCSIEIDAIQDEFYKGEFYKVSFENTYGYISELENRYSPC